jgi:hypothetical protein
MRRYLVVANQTLGGEALMRRIREAQASEPSSFHLLVPATAPRHQYVSTEGEAIAIARQRLDEGIARLHAEGIDVSGSVGDANPLLAVADITRDEQFDEVIVSTLPIGASRWVKMDLPARLRRRLAVPVVHVVAEPEPAV